MQKSGCSPRRIHGLFAGCRVNQLGQALDVPLPTTAITNELLTSARAMGFEHQDFAIVYEVLAAMSGLRQV